MTLCGNGVILPPMGKLQLENEGLSAEELIRKAKRIPGAWTGVKIAVLILIRNGSSPGELSNIFGLSRQTLSRWVHEANDRGLESLEKTPPPGRPKQLTDEIRRDLVDDLENTPEHFGYKRKKWNATILMKHLEDQYDIQVKVRQARNYLKEIGYTDTSLNPFVPGKHEQQV